MSWEGRATENVHCRTLGFRQRYERIGRRARPDL